MDSKLLARIAAIIFIAVSLTMTAIELTRTPKPGRGELGSAAVDPVAVDPLRAELSRCQRLGQAGASDSACLVAWDENRRRFLGQPVIARGVTPTPTPATPSDQGQ